jgi:hypothetical protein
MVAPIWEKFPEKTLRDHTSFYLQLSGDYAEDELVHEIRQLDPRMLIFLRQLKEINLTVAHSDGKLWTQNLRRTDKVENGTLFTTLHQESSSWQYIITRHHFENLPPEPKRPGCLNSEVLIAFPVSDAPKRTPQSVYAFLPIGDYGFQVSILRQLMQGCV